MNVESACDAAENYILIYLLIIPRVKTFDVVLKTRVFFFTGDDTKGPSISLLGSTW